MKETEITPKMIYILLDWLKSVNTSLEFTNICYCYACTLFYVIYSKMLLKINKKNLQLYGMIALRYSSLIINDNLISNYLIRYLTDNGYELEEIENTTIEVFNILQGRLIYPSPIFFVDQNDKDLTLLTEFATSIPEISIFKPSLVAYTCKYMLTGKHTIYTVDEMSYICFYIQEILNQVVRSSLESYNNKTKILLPKINVVCKTGDIIFKSTYKYNEPWHLGEFEEFGQVGEGGYGKIIKIKRKACGKEYVTKLFEEHHLESFLSEIAILKLLANNANVIPICGFDYSLNQFKIILPVMKGSVWDLVKLNRLDKSKYSKYIGQILKGIHQCHDNDLIHRDIKPQNILYDQETDNMVIIDFGISVTFQSFKNVRDTNMANTINYRPPECLLFEYQRYDQKIDIWALGCVFFYIITEREFVNFFFDNNKSLLIKIFNQLGTPSNKE
jgi:hypothetical protein